MSSALFFFKMEAIKMTIDLGLISSLMGKPFNHGCSLRIGDEGTYLAGEVKKTSDGDWFFPSRVFCGIAGHPAEEIFQITYDDGYRSLEIGEVDSCGCLHSKIRP